MLGSLVRRGTRAAFPTISQFDYLQQYIDFVHNGVEYVLPYGGTSEVTAFQGESNPIVAAAIGIRASVFSEIRFAYQAFEAGRPDRLFGNRDLQILERPWPGGHTNDLLACMEVDASLFGNSYWVRVFDRLVRIDPPKVKTIVGDAFDEATRRPIGPTLLGYAVIDDSGNDVAMYGPDEMVHYAPLKSAQHPFTGRSWLSSVLPDVTVDRRLTEFKQSFVANGAMPGMAITYPPGVTKEQIEAVKAAVDKNHAGSGRAFNTLHLGGGADPKVVGASFDQLDMKNVQGGLETRIAAASGVPATVLGISEGLQGSQLNAGNYVASRRRFADGTIRPLWRSACAALESVAPPPDGLTRLWYDDRDVPFLQEDVLDAAKIRSEDAATLRQLVDGGFDPQSAVTAVITGDMSRLVHSGNLSVQLQPANPADQGNTDTGDFPNE